MQGQCLSRSGLKSNSSNFRLVNLFQALKHWATDIKTSSEQIKITKASEGKGTRGRAGRIGAIFSKLWGLARFPSIVIYNLRGWSRLHACTNKRKISSVYITVCNLKFSFQRSISESDSANWRSFYGIIKIKSTGRSFSCIFPHFILLLAKR